MDRREQRFWRKVGRKDKNGCRKWQNELDGKGYGHCNYNGLRTTAHRIAYMLTHGGELPGPGLVVMHTCDVRSCCNPDHLEIGTQAKNLADMRAKGRAGDCRVFGEKHGTSKLKKLQVRKIRQLYAQGALSQRKLAEKFGVGHSQIHRIVSGVSRLYG